MSHNYFGFVFDIAADSMCLSSVYLVDVSVTISLSIFWHILQVLSVKIQYI